MNYKVGGVVWVLIFEIGCGFDVSGGFVILEFCCFLLVCDGQVMNMLIGDGL